MERELFSTQQDMESFMNFKRKQLQYLQAEYTLWTESRHLPARILGGLMEYIIKNSEDFKKFCVPGYAYIRAGIEPQW